MGDGQQVGEELWRDVGPVKAGSRSVAAKEGKRLDVGMEMRETICEAKGGHQVGQGWAPFVPEGPSCVYWPQNTIEVPYEQGGAGRAAMASATSTLKKLSLSAALWAPEGAWTWRKETEEKVTSCAKPGVKSVMAGTSAARYSRTRRRPESGGDGETCETKPSHW